MRHRFLYGTGYGKTVDRKISNSLSLLVKVVSPLSCNNVRPKFPAQQQQHASLPTPAAPVPCPPWKLLPIPPRNARRACSSLRSKRKVVVICARLQLQTHNAAIAHRHRAARGHAPCARVGVRVRLRVCRSQRAVLGSIDISARPVYGRLQAHRTPPSRCLASAPAPCAPPISRRRACASKRPLSHLCITETASLS